LKNRTRFFLSPWRQQFRLWLLISFMLGWALACQTVTQWARPAPVTEQPLSGSAVLTGQQLEIFDELWQIVQEEYLYEDFNGVDWDGTGDLYREKVRAGLTPEAFYLAMDEMIASLGDEHSVFLSPEQALEEDAEYAGNLDYVGVGIYVVGVPERNRATIILTFPGSPAERAGLQPHDSILMADGQPILDENGEIRDIVRGPEGTSVTLTVQTPGMSPRELVVPRARINSSIPIPSRVHTTPDGKRFGYLLLSTFADNSVDDRVGDALQAMSAGAPLDGLIIDNRWNEGGVDVLLRGTLAYFIDGAAGYFISREEARPLQVQKNDVPISRLISEAKRRNI